MWNSTILEELHECEQEKLVERVGLAPLQALEAADRLVGTLRPSFDDAEVDDWERFVDTGELPDPDDRHVVACAIAGRADAIVTSNLKNFRAPLVPMSIEVVPQRLSPCTTRRSTRVLGVPSTASCAGAARRVEPGVRSIEVLESRYAMTEAVAYLRS